jgi:hypothetical protein
MKFVVGQYSTKPKQAQLLTPLSCQSVSDHKNYGKMETSQALLNLILGGVLGLLGQGIRVVAGLKKLHDITQEPLKQNEQYDPRRLRITLFLGFIAGGLGIVTFMDDSGSVILNKDVMLTLIGIGYGGVDFIESFLSKYIASSTSGRPLDNLSESSTDKTESLSKTSAFGVQNVVFDLDEPSNTPRQKA